MGRSEWRLGVERGKSWDVAGLWELIGWGGWLFGHKTFVYYNVPGTSCGTLWLEGRCCGEHKNIRLLQKYWGFFSRGGGGGGVCWDIDALSLKGQLGDFLILH